MPLLDILGNPIAPAPDPPSVEDLQRLRRMNPRYDLRWFNGAPAPYWAFVERWKGSDPRWARVQAGEMSREMAFDLLAQVPGYISGNEAVAWLEKSARRVDDPVKEAAAMVDATIKANADTKAAHVDTFMNEQVDQAVRLSRRQRKVRDGEEKATPLVGAPMASKGRNKGTQFTAAEIAARAAQEAPKGAIDLTALHDDSEPLRGK